MMTSINSEPDEDDERYNEFFQSIGTKTGLEIGVSVTWPGVPSFELSTCLAENEIAPMFHGTQWAGTRIWRAAIVTLQHLLHQNDCGQIKLDRETTFLELGCGLGVPGLLLGLICECDVLLTDRDSLLEQLKNNIEQLYDKHHHDIPKRIQAASLDWSVEGVTRLADSIGKRKGFDVVVNCDCIYEPLYGSSWRKLLECQEEFLRLNPDTYMLTSVERRRADGVDSYIALMKKSPVVERIELVQIPFDYPREVEIYRIYGKKHQQEGRACLS